MKRDGCGNETNARKRYVALHPDVARPVPRFEYPAGLVLAKNLNRNRAMRFPLATCHISMFRRERKRDNWTLDNSSEQRFARGLLVKNLFYPADLIRRDRGRTSRELRIATLRGRSNALRYTFRRGSSFRLVNFKRHADHRIVRV